MANSDASQYVLRYNEITGNLEFGSGNNWTAISFTTTTPVFTNVTTPLITGNGTVPELTIRPTTDSTSALEITNAASSGTPIFTIDTIDNFVGINTLPVNMHNALTVTGTIACTSTVLSPNITVNQGILFINPIGTDAAIRAISPATNGYVFYSNDTHYMLTGNGTQFGVVQVNQVFAEAGTGTVTPNATSASTLTIPVSGAVTLNGPTNGYDGQKITLRVVNDGSHSVTLAAGAGNFAFGTTIPSYTNSVSLIDYIGVIWNTSAGVWHVVSVSKGF